MEPEARRFSEVEVGDEIGPVTRVAETDMVRRYARVTGVEALRFFFDPQAARENGFERPVVPGPLSVAFLAKMLKDAFVGWRLRSLNTTFRAPIPHGVEISLWGTVTEKEHGGEGRGAVHCDVVIESPAGERLAVGTAVLEWAG
jgi:acyl dehydratase